MNNRDTVVHSHKNGDVDYEYFDKGITNFDIDKRVGDWGESRFTQWMTKQFGVMPIRQRGNKHWDYNVTSDVGMMKFEIKTNYRDDQKIVIEEWSSLDKKPGWIYTCDADVLVTMSTRTMIWMHLPSLHYHWDSIRSNYCMHTNNPNTRNNYVSAYYRIDLSDIIDAIGSDRVQVFNMN